MAPSPSPSPTPTPTPCPPSSSCSCGRVSLYTLLLNASSPLRAQSVWLRDRVAALVADKQAASPAIPWWYDTELREQLAWLLPSNDQQAVLNELTATGEAILARQRGVAANELTEQLPATSACASIAELHPAPLPVCTAAAHLLNSSFAHHDAEWYLTPPAITIKQSQQASNNLDRLNININDITTTSTNRSYSYMADEPAVPLQTLTASDVCSSSATDASPSPPLPWELQYSYGGCYMRPVCHSSLLRCLSNRSIAFVGDSVTRYTFVSLIHFLTHKDWMWPYQRDPAGYANLVRTQHTTNNTETEHARESNATNKQQRAAKP